MTTTTRRQLVQTGGALAVGAALPVSLARLGEAVGNGDLPPRDDVSHLLSRITFGLKASELEQARREGYEATLDRQLDPDSIDASAVEDGIAARLPTQTMSLPELLGLVREPDGRRQVYREFQLATLMRAVWSPRQLDEVMVELWGNHFAVNVLDGPLRVLKPYEDRAVMRRHALGRFRDLLRADARSPAMLYSLDNISNVKDGPNENYARELLELHTLGVDGGYTERDVGEVARIFTGWAFSRRTGAFRFLPGRHDYASKEVLGVHFPRGRGLAEGEELLDLLAGHPATATHLATKLARRFVADDPPVSLVEEVAGTFRATDGDIRQTLRSLLLSSEFAAAQDAKLKRPFDYVVSVLRATTPEVSEPGYRALYRTLDTLGQVPYAWPAPDGYPDTASHWLSTSSLLARWQFALGLADGTLDRLFHLDAPGSLAWAVTPAAIVDALVDRFLGRPVTADDRAELIAFAADGLGAHAWIPPSDRLAAVRGVLGLILVSRYFELR